MSIDFNDAELPEVRHRPQGGSSIKTCSIIIEGISESEIKQINLIENHLNNLVGVHIAKFDISNNRAII